MIKLDRPDLLAAGLFIDGEWIHTGKTLAVTNPATGALIANIADAGLQETRAAIAAASAALPMWRQKTAKERSTILKRWYALIIKNLEDLANILTSEQGKTLAEARGEIMYGASYIEWFAEEAKRIDGDIIPPPDNNKRLLVIKQPVGVVTSITPWNFPNAMICRKAAPALAAGCTFVCKPASLTPLSALALCALAREAGIPAGVLNMIVSSNHQVVGKELTTNPAVRKFTFTGSTGVGKILMQQCISTCKRVSMELGGNAPFIVFDDADVDAAVAGAIASKYRNSGQTCVCSNRFFVQAGIHDEFVAKLDHAMREFKLGNGLDEGVTHGPLITENAVKNVDALVRDAVDAGAIVVRGGALSSLGACFYEPTLLANAQRHMRVFREEIFGPVAPVFKFDTEAEAIEMANDTEFGLAAYFYTRDLARIFRVGEALEYGMIGINEGIISNEMAPFGGVKESGFGREGSRYGIMDYLEIKYLCVGIGE